MARYLGVTLIIGLSIGVLIHCGAGSGGGAKQPGDEAPIQPDPETDGTGSAEGKPGDANSPGNSKVFRVAVIDDGFDDSLPVFAKKVVAKWTLQCDEDEPSIVDEFKQLPYDRLKQKILEEIEKNEDRCKLVESLDFKKSSAFSGIKQYREAWNRRYFAKDPGILSDSSGGGSGSSGQSGMSARTKEQIYDVLRGEKKYSYHGTNVASLIAYKNEKVELVLIQIELGAVDFLQAYSL